MTEIANGPMEWPWSRVPLPEGARYTVLVAEDDTEMRKLLVDWLEAMDCAVVECEDGEDLIDLLMRVPSDELSRIDAIITDERMPRSHGLAALESLWFMPLPPVLLITAYGDTKLWARARGLGDVAVLPKPFDRAALSKAVSELLRPRDDDGERGSVGG